MILHKVCPTCQKKAVAVSEEEIAGVRFTILKCGHYIDSIPLKLEDLNLTSEDGWKPYNYQIDGAKFVIEKANGRALICDQMGLGKTIQALAVVKSQKFKFLIVAKSGLRMQWFKETIRWCGEEFMPQIIESEEHPFLKCKGFIISIDLLYRFKDLEAWIKRLSPDCIILDECQSIKNHESKRTNCVRCLAANTDHFIALSGTPIKNHAGEYFPILNILHPEKFPSLVVFNSDWVDGYFDVRSGKWKRGGIKNIDKFMQYTGDFIIRRTRADVDAEIKLSCGNDPIRRNRFSELGKTVQRMYQATLDEFAKYYLYSNDSEFQRSSNILAYMAKMRHITGLAKIDSVVDYIQDFIIENEYERKFVLFCHHNDVMDKVIEKLKEIQSDETTSGEFGQKICQIRSEMNMMTRESELDDFRSNKSRIMIASTLASSEGLNIQFCSDYGIMERQWNPANEEQAEARFIRIGQTAKVVNGTYFIATGTIDEFFAELVERKRSIMAQALDGKEVKWDETSIIRELADILASQNKSRWLL